MKTRIAGLVLALLTAAPLSAQTTNGEIKRAITEKIEAAHEQLAEAQRLLGEIADAVASPEEFQAALDAGGVVTLPPLQVFTAARFTVSKPNTTVRCNGSLVMGTTGPAFHVKPGAHDYVLDDCSMGSAWPGAVLQIGDNDPVTQSLAAQVPQRGRVILARIASHRGKRGIEMNGAGTIDRAHVENVYATTLQDSQAINILNTCGPVEVLNSTLSAGSEVLLIGGDTLKVKDCPEGVVAHVRIEGNTLTRPASWQTDGVKYAPKNTLEIKAGKHIVVRDNEIQRSWRSTLSGDPTQDGSAIVITPRNGQFIADVLFEENTITDVAQGVQLMGRDVSTTPQTTDIVFRGNTWTIDGPAYNGRGVLALVVAGMGAVTWEYERVTHTGTSLFLVDSKEPVGPFSVTGSTMTTGRLVCAAPGVNYCGPTPPDRAPFTLFAAGNMFADAPSQFKALYPENTFVTRAELDAAIAR